MSDNKIPQTTPVKSATFDDRTNSEIRRAAALAFMTFGVAVLSAGFPILMTCCFWAPRSPATRSKAIGKSVKPPLRSAHATPNGPLSWIFRLPSRA